MTPISPWGTTTTLGAIVNWRRSDFSLTTGAITYQLSDQGPWVGPATLTYTYNSGSLQGVFTDASITFNPASPTGTKIKIIYTASGPNGMIISHSSTEKEAIVPWLPTVRLNSSGWWR